MFKTKTLNVSMNTDKLFDFDDIFDSFNFDGVVHRARDSGELTLKEDADGVYLYIDVPGFKKKDLSISIDGNNLLSIKGTASSGGRARTLDIVRKLHTSLEVSETTARLRDGILMVFVPKKNPSNQSGGTISVEIE